MARFKQEVLDIIRSDADLFASVAKAMDVKPYSLPGIILRNGNSLNQYSIVVLVANHLGRDPEEITESESEDTISAKEEQN